MCSKMSDAMCGSLCTSWKLLLQGRAAIRMHDTCVRACMALLTVLGMRAAIVTCVCESTAPVYTSDSCRVKAGPHVPATTHRVGIRALGACCAARLASSTTLTGGHTLSVCSTGLQNHTTTRHTAWATSYNSGTQAPHSKNDGDLVLQLDGGTCTAGTHSFSRKALMTDGCLCASDCGVLHQTMLPLQDGVAFAYC